MLVCRRCCWSTPEEWISLGLPTSQIGQAQATVFRNRILIEVTQVAGSLNRILALSAGKGYF